MAALKQLKKQQQERNIVIKPYDKMEGQSVMNTEEYVEKVQQMLQIKKYLNESVEAGIVNKEYAKNLLPDEPTPGRFYGLVKNHIKPPEGETIPPLRPVVSGSGSNTEMISWLVDTDSKEMVPKLPSYWQDTPHALRDLKPCW